MARRNRDEEFRAEYPDLYRRAYSSAYRIAGERTAAQELAQEALTRAYENWDKLDERRVGWVVTIAARLAIDAWRRESRTRQRILQSPAPIDAVAADRLDMVRALAALPRRQREVAVLRYLEDMPEVTVARILGCSVGTVKQHASRALVALRSGLAPSVPTEGK